MIDMSITFRKYAPLWNKYRPAILKMMLAAAYEPQQYKLMQHEIQAMDEKKKTGFGFNLFISGSKATNNIKDSEIAQDLLNMLLLSRKGAELVDVHSYEIMLDKKFVLHINQVSPIREN
ncbi:MAG TPA: hypothetical protein VGK39_03145 [Cyclobacteriaceae bacterium]